MSAAEIIFDIETGGQPWEKIAHLYTPPEKLAPWSESMVAYGNTKDPDKRKAKYDEVFAAYRLKLANEQTDHESHRLAWLADAALSAMTGQVVAIGVKSEKGMAIYDCTLDEEAALKKWWGLVEKNLIAKRRYIGHNSTGFDWPFLIQRSYILGVDVPGMIRRGRYLHDDLIDTQEVFGCGKRPFFITLADLSKAMGGSGKPDDCTGAMFAAKYRSGDAVQRAVAETYLKNDLLMTWYVAERMGLIQ